MFKRKVTLLLAVLLAGCGDPGVTKVVEGTVTQVYEDTSPLGCVGTNWNMAIRLDDGRVAKMCGRFARVGDRIRGCWTDGSTEGLDSPNRDGFHFSCKEFK